MKKITISIVRALLCLKKHESKRLNIKATVSSLCILITCNTILLAQDQKVIDLVKTGIQIGQQVPEVTIGQIQNYTDINGKPATSLKLSDFKGKLLILDFWATWCAPCVAMIPKIKVLEKTFEGKLQFVPVTYQSKKEVNTFLSRYDNGKYAKLMGITDDKVLHQLFPHIYLPHYVWIDGNNGKVIAITNHEAATAETIGNAIRNKVVNLKQKADLNLTFDHNRTILEQQNPTINSQVMWNSTLTSHIPGLVASQRIFPPDSLQRFRILAHNKTIAGLYKLAYADLGIDNYNRLILKVKDSTTLTSLGQSAGLKDWQTKHTYNFDFMAGGSLAPTQASFFELMRTQLATYFPKYQTSITQKNTLCLVLSRTSELDKIGSSKGDSYFKNNTLGFDIKNYPISMFVKMLNITTLQNLSTPVVDGTNYMGPVDLNLVANMTNVSAINAALAKYDLQLVEKSVSIPYLLIEDKP